MAPTTAVTQPTTSSLPAGAPSSLTPQTRRSARLPPSPHKPDGRRASLPHLTNPTTAPLLPLLTVVPPLPHCIALICLYRHLMARATSLDPMPCISDLAPAAAVATGGHGIEVAEHGSCRIHASRPWLFHRQQFCNPTQRWLPAPIPVPDPFGRRRWGARPGVSVSGAHFWLCTAPAQLRPVGGSAPCLHLHPCCPRQRPLRPAMHFFILNRQLGCSNHGCVRPGRGGPNSSHWVLAGGLLARVMECLVTYSAWCASPAL